MDRPPQERAPRWVRDLAHLGAWVGLVLLVALGIVALIMIALPEPFLGEMDVLFSALCGGARDGASAGPAVGLR